MRIGSRHLGYCTNVHPAETWPQLRAMLVERVAAVKARACPDRPMGVGLRLSAIAAEALDTPRALDELRGLLDALGLYVFSLNGFPYGEFHGRRVKEQVYLPDWLDERRLTYTQRLARICAALCPDRMGTVSTVPGAFRDRVRSDADEAAIADRLRRLAAFLEELGAKSGKTVVLALEPEPACFLETTDEAAGFFERRLLGGGDEARVRRHLGVCLDACHLAVGFEPPAQAVRRLRQSGISIAKLQLSTALHVHDPKPDTLAALRAFADDVYLHQVTQRNDDGLRRFLDLDRALLTAAPGATWRVHFHVPIFLRELGPFESTQPELADLLGVVDETGCTHLEVETYTWSVLPARHREAALEDAIARELRWVETRL